MQSYHIEVLTGLYVVTNKDPISKHVAGIIPVANTDTSIELLLPPSLLPLDNNFYAIQRSVLECAYAGCKTIWIICGDNEAPVLKKVCGDFVTDPRSVTDMKYKKYPSQNLKQIPIFYVPISYKNSNRIGPGAAILDCITSAFVVSSKLSKWVEPHRYYISMPYGVYDPSVAYEMRRDIRSYESCILTYDDKSLFDNCYLGFSLSPRQFKHCNYLFKTSSVKENYTLDKTFGCDIMKENMVTKSINIYHDITTWAGYTNSFQGDNVVKIFPFWKKLFNCMNKN